jgi:hypothetical protein
VSDHQIMSIKRVVWHVVEKTIELTLQSQETPPRPEWVREDLWYGGAGESVSIVIPVGKRLNTAAPTGIGLIGQDAEGKDIYTRYTWDAKTSAWINPVRVNPSTGLPV